jgi:antitoxin (DNA-binding transcriptional repressor) of toxin-antitoxin stability system
MSQTVRRIEVSEVVFPDILDEVRASGESVVIVRDGRPVAEIAPPPPADEDAEASAAWFDRVYGALAGDEEFERTIDEVVRSRQDQMPRPSPMDEDTP